MHSAPLFQPEYREQDMDNEHQTGGDDTVGLSLGTTPYYDELARTQPLPQLAPASGQPSELRASTAVATDSNHRKTSPAYSKPFSSTLRRYLHFSVNMDRRTEEIALPDNETVGMTSSTAHIDSNFHGKPNGNLMLF